MAKLKSDSVLQGKALPLSAGTEVELLRPTDRSHSRFEVTWHMPNGDNRVVVKTKLLKRA